VFKRPPVFRMSIADMVVLDGTGLIRPPLSIARDCFGTAAVQGGG